MHRHTVMMAAAAAAGAWAGVAWQTRALGKAGETPGPAESAAKATANPAAAGAALAVVVAMMVAGKK